VRQALHGREVICSYDATRSARRQPPRYGAQPPGAARKLLLEKETPSASALGVGNALSGNAPLPVVTRCRHA